MRVYIWLIREYMLIGLGTFVGRWISNAIGPVVKCYWTCGHIGHAIEEGFKFWGLFRGEFVSKDTLTLTLNDPHNAYPDPNRSSQRVWKILCADIVTIMGNYSGSLQGPLVISYLLKHVVVFSLFSEGTLQSFNVLYPSRYIDCVWSERKNKAGVALPHHLSGCKLW